MVNKISEIVGLRPHPTVVRLEESVDEAWIAESYHLTGDVQRHLGALRHALSCSSGTGAFLIGQYGSGKSHFLAYLAQQLRQGRLVEPAPDVVVLSLLNYSAEARLEEVIGAALGIPPPGTGDRRLGWGRADERHPRGLLLVLDELSEFLRSKPGRSAYNEDIRFLQFLGEWAQDHRFFLVAAMQEAIEHTGEIEHASYRKIQDRFPLRLRLTPGHVRDLVAERILVKRPGYAAAVDGLAARLEQALPGAAVDLAALREIYPIHPATLELLAEVRDRFSQTRGVVEFVTTQLGGAPERLLPPFLEREIGELVTPDLIVTHFADVLEQQPEFLPLSQQLFPWYHSHLAELFDSERLRQLAERLLRLLVLVHLAPGREGLTVDEASSWLLFAATRIDPAKNRAVIERVLERLAQQGRYVRAEGKRFALDLAGDEAARLEKLIEHELAEL
ncbi:MAG: ATP-binding protein, partial [Deltaproteobacteria bacterium]|nr:ATP-binding protein [Deltaproteobacteria bacterium]